MSSTRQASLGEMLRESIEEESTPDTCPEYGETALYSKPTGRETDASKQITHRVCLNCSRNIEAEVARVMGDNHGCVEGCVQCTENAHGLPYESDVVAAQAAKLGAAVFLEEDER